MSVVFARAPLRISLGGGGGFLLVFTASPEDTRAAMEGAGAPELRFDIDAEGCVAWAHG